jgi:hypothetical protein
LIVTALIVSRGQTRRECAEDLGLFDSPAATVWPEQALRLLDEFRARNHHAVRAAERIEQLGRGIHLASGSRTG